MSDALLSTLAEALAELVTAVETSDEEVLDPDTAVKWLESTAATLSALPAADRRALDGHFRAVALRRPEGPWRDELLRVPEAFGLTEDTPAPAHIAARATTPVATRVPLHTVTPADAGAATLTDARAVRLADAGAATHGAAHAAEHAATDAAAPAAAHAPTPPAAHAAACEALARQARRFVATVRGADPAAPVPTCPGWTLAELTRHLGTVHHWAEHLVRTRATVRVHAGDVPLGLPRDPAAYPDWLAAGAEALVATLRAADPDTPLWSPGPDPRAGYYPRHVLFEAVVHLADAELALTGAAEPIDPGTAAEGIEHHLATLLYVPRTAERIAHLDRDGELLRFTARDTGTVWTLTLGGGGFTRRRGSAESAERTEPTAGVTGDSGDLLLLLHRRYTADDPRFAHTGDRALLDAWLTATAL